MSENTTTDLELIDNCTTCEPTDLETIEAEEPSFALVLAQTAALCATTVLATYGSIAVAGIVGEKLGEWNRKRLTKKVEKIQAKLAEEQPADESADDEWTNDAEDPDDN